MECPLEHAARVGLVENWQCLPIQPGVANPKGARCSPDAPNRAVKLRIILKKGLIGFCTDRRTQRTWQHSRFSPKALQFAPPQLPAEPYIPVKRTVQYTDNVGRNV